LGFQRGECTNLQHTNHTLPPGIERKTILELDQGQTADRCPLISLFNVDTSQFGACTEGGILNIWNDNFIAGTKLALGVPCSAAACFSTPEGEFLVFGTFFQEAPAPNQYGICATDGNKGVTFPVILKKKIGKPWKSNGYSSG
jgi:hypothetical protein